MTEYCFYRFLFTVIGQEHNFDKIKTNNLETAYDYSSVMHYGRQVFLSCLKNMFVLSGYQRKI